MINRASTEAPAHPSILEVAHVLFIDIVAYSRLPMDEQEHAIQVLNECVRDTAEFTCEDAQHHLICLPTGDGMALAFFGDVEAPVRCAIELTRKLRDHPEIKLRMGIHTGPVYRVADINAASNVSGGGINIAQRVMDCGDAGHILLSSDVANVLAQVSRWRGALHDFGVATVKHGVRVHVYNLCTPETGNPHRPAKLRSEARRHWTKRWVMPAVAVVLSLVWWGAEQLKHTSLHDRRRSIAVLRFTNLSGNPEANWLATSLAEVLTTELSAGDRLRVIPPENVARMQSDLALSDLSNLARETLRLVHHNLDSDLVVSGTYLALGSEVRVDVRLQNTDGSNFGAWSENGGVGSTTELESLVHHIGQILRERCGAGETTVIQQAEIAATIAPNPEAERLYSEGLESLRWFDALTARERLEKAVAAAPDFAPSHSALSDALRALGFDERARREAKAAVELAGKLPEQSRALIEGRYLESEHQWDKAAVVYRRLWEAHRDSLDYALRVIGVQISESTPHAALAMVTELKRLPAPESTDPRITLAQAQASEQLSDFFGVRAAAEVAIQQGRDRGARLLVASGLHFRGVAAWKMGDPVSGMNDLQEARMICTSVGDRNCIANELFAASRIARSQGKLHGAESAALQAIATYRESGNQTGILTVMNSLGLLYQDHGDLRAAVETYRNALPIAQEIGDRRLQAHLLGNLGNVLSEQGELRQAEMYHEQAVATYRDIGDKSHWANELNSLANVLHDRGDLDAASRMHREAIDLARQSGEKRYLAFALSAYGDLLADMGDLDEATERHKEALALWKEIGGELDAEYDLVSLEEVAAEKGIVNSEGRLRDAIERYQAEGDADDLLRANVILIRVLLLQHKLKEAEAQTRTAEFIAPKVQSTDYRFAFDIARARVAAETGNTAAGLRTLKAVLVRANKSNWVTYALEARLNIAEIQLKITPPLGKAELLRVRQEASNLGYGLIVRQATQIVTMPAHS